MWVDPVVEEVRAIREAYVRQFDYDLDAICRDLKQREAQGKWKVVSLPPKRVVLEKQDG